MDRFNDRFRRAASDRHSGDTTKKRCALLLALVCLLAAVLPGCGADDFASATVIRRDEPADADLPEYGEYYYDLENVVLYLDIYGELPLNYITKDEARDLGWQGGSVEDYLEGAAIGGDRFGNREGLLPEAPGRSYTECDIDTDGYGSRGARRLVFSSDGLYFYSSDHYESFDPVTITENYEVVW